MMTEEVGPPPAGGVGGGRPLPPATPGGGGGSGRQSILSSSPPSPPPPPLLPTGGGGNPMDMVHYLHQGTPGGTNKQHSRVVFNNNNLLPVSSHNSNLTWKSAEDIYLSSSGGNNLLNQVMETDDLGPSCEVVCNNPTRLVSSLSAYPLSNTNNAVSAGLTNPTAATPVAAAASTSNIPASSSYSLSSTNSASYSSGVQYPTSSSTIATSGVYSNPSYANTSHTTSASGHHHHHHHHHQNLQGPDVLSSVSPATSALAGDVNNSSQCNSSIGGVTPLDLSGIPPITQVTLPTPTENGEGRFSQSPVPSPKPSPTLVARQTSCDSSDDRATKQDACDPVSRECSLERSLIDPMGDHQLAERILDSTSRSSESSRSVEAPRTPDINNSVLIKERKESSSKSTDKKNNKAWYKMLNPTYKSRSEDLKRLFKDLPSDERLIVDYSCALQKDILVHGRLYVTPNYFCFYSKIFGWETFVSIKCKDIIAMTKEKTALVIPNAVEIKTDGEKHFFTSFASRDKTYLMLFRIWQNALMDQQMSATELWQWVHSSYGDELGLTSDDDDYVAPSTEDDTKTNTSHMHSDRACDSSSFNASLKLYSADSIEDPCQADVSVDETPIGPIPRNGGGGGDSEASELASIQKTPLPKAPLSPTKSPQHQTPLNSTPQTNDTIPTDMSDSTDTEPDSKVTCLPSGESVVCPNLTSHHQGREIINTVYALPVDTVFTLLFTNSKFMLDIYTARKTSDVIASPWQSNPETNQKIRQVTYTLTLPPNSFGPKVSHVTETQVVSPFSKHGEIYTVDAEACNAGIPYADSFFVSNHWCLTRESSTETRISVWSQVKYKKNVWGFMKGVIDKNAFSGVESLLNDINAALLAEVDRTNLKRTRRRRRRGGSKGDPPDVLLPTHADKVKDIHKATQIPARKLTLPIVTPDSSIASNEGPVRVVVAILVILLTLNALLYYKLWALEEKVFLHASPNPPLDPSLFKSGSPGSPMEEWVRILQHQEALHAAEVERWQKSIEEAAGYLRKAEESLRNLHASIPPHHATKIQLLLRQIQNLHEAESHRKSSSGSSNGQEGSPVMKAPDILDYGSTDSFGRSPLAGNQREL